MDQLTAAQVEYKENKKKKKNKGKNKNLTPEELQKMKEKQNALFEKAAHDKVLKSEFSRFLTLFRSEFRA